MRFVKKPCQHCPFRVDVKPYLHPARAEEIAYHTQNKYNSFPCHVTTESDENSDSGERMITDKSLECAGFLTLRAQEGIPVPANFKPAFDLVYPGISEMIEAYAEARPRK